MRKGAMKAVLLAGGFGTRLQSIVKDVPKPMADIGGTPFLEILMGNLADCGIEAYYLCVGYKREVIEHYFGHSFRGLPVFYSCEDEPLGTGGAIKKAYDEFSLEAALVLNGDTFVQMDYAAFFAANRERNLAIALRQVEDTSRYGKVETLGDRVIAFREKEASSGSGYISAGVYVIRPALWGGRSLPPCFSLEKDIIEPYAARPDSNIGFCKTAGYFIDIGVPESYAEARAELKAKMGAMMPKAP